MSTVLAYICLILLKPWQAVRWECHHPCAAWNLERVKKVGIQVVFRASLVDQLVKNPPAMQCGRPGLDSWVSKIPWRRERLPTPVFWPGEFHALYSPWEKAMVPHSSTLAWKIPWMEEPGRLQSMGSLRVGHD